MRCTINEPHTNALKKKLKNDRHTVDRPTKQLARANDDPKQLSIVNDRHTVIVVHHAITFFSFYSFLTFFSHINIWITALAISCCSKIFCDIHQD